jgi:hypothetical protein
MHLVEPKNEEIRYDEKITQDEQDESQVECTAFYEKKGCQEQRKDQVCSRDGRYRCKDRKKK